MISHARLPSTPSVHESDVGAAVDNLNNQEWTALAVACRCGDAEYVRASIDAQADLELDEPTGERALSIACESSPLCSFNPGSVHLGRPGER